MGRWSWNKKTTVEECHSISTTFLKQHDYFCGFRSGGMKWTNSRGEETGSVSFSVKVNEWSGEIRFQYTNTSHSTGQKENLDYPVRLTFTPCNYGGKRWWFICPLVKNGVPCSRRVSKLYLNGKYFGCRHCYDLTYTSAQEHDKRIDALLRNPDLLINAFKKPNDLGMNLLAMKAYFKLEEKEKKKGRRL